MTPILKVSRPTSQPARGTFLWLLVFFALLTAALQPAIAGGVVSVPTEAALKSALSGGGSVTIATDGVITLTSSIDIEVPTVIDATGHNITISGTNSVQVFRVNFLDGTGTFTMRNVQVTRGRAFSGAGMDILNGVVNLFDCTFSTNQTLTAIGTLSSGAAIRNRGTLHISGCTFVGNRVNAGALDGFGGAIYNSGNLSVTNSTFAGNSILGSGAGGSAGGALYNIGSGLTPVSTVLLNCTFATNVIVAGTNVVGFGANIFNSGSLLLNNSILASGLGTNYAGVVTDGGNNISSDSSPVFTRPTSRNNLDPKLARLADNGGPTLTMALLPESPAIDAANASSSPPVDQRGIARPSGAGFDIGAFEAASGATVQAFVQFSTTTYSTNKNATNAIISVLLGNGATGTVSVAFATENGTALAGTNYVATHGVLAFALGETNKTFRVPILNPPLSFGDKTLSLLLSNATGAVLGSRSRATLTIIDNVAGANLQTALDAGGTVNFPTDTSITVTNTLLIKRDVVIDGSGRNITFSGGGTNGVRIFYVTNDVSLTLIHVTLSNGKAPLGGAIYNDLGRVQLSDCTFSGNRGTGTPGRNGSAGTPSSRDGTDGSTGGAGIGGAIYSRGSLFVTNCVFSNNSATGGNGGSGGNGANDSSFGGNGGDGGDAGRGWGGAIYSAGPASIVTTSFDGNHATGGNGGTPGGGGAGSYPGIPGNGGAGQNGVGGAIFNADTMSIERSTLSANTAAGGDSKPAANENAGKIGGTAAGGAIYSAGVFNLVNCTVASNTAKGGAGGNGGNGSFAKDGGAGGDGTGGGIYGGLTVNLLHATIAANGATGGAGGKGGSGSYPGADGSSGLGRGGNIARPNGNFSVANSIIANPATNGNCWNGLTDGGHNISSDGSCKFTAAGSRNNLNPRLGPLASNGGITKTMALLTNSPAIDSADSSVCPSIDQRGIGRPQGADCDIGAFEAVISFSISGRISDGTNGLGGVAVTSEGRSAVTDTNGNYSLTGFTNGTYVVTPSAAGAGFTPTNRSVTISGGNVSGADFTANRPVVQSIIAPPVPNPAGPFTMNFLGTPQQTYQIETSTNLLDWSVYTNAVANGSGAFSASATNSPVLPQQFFRTRNQ